ncbi:hypothetical protein KKD19_00710 [Patescibacteria group bacterium]|nr:hypothetical protein [Patescibacteria group bacterium]MBU4511753.1 hypothetical protein [Patescibacteria group bacterium]MCG2693607.1 hypothetical protein [Candidatus Parcubacteria bacterium]
MGCPWYFLAIAFGTGVLTTLLVTGRRLVRYGRIVRIVTLQYYWDRIWFLESVEEDRKLKRAVGLLDDIARRLGCRWFGES